ncbi:hypothetical protein VNO78_13448 [Psophocarpus tetragonolobus]|uniref:Fe2OG dioxygenase domain-containing protein n=1 Tax=Psophocarpus tetragonolobus TaxID=3891 RepID=A0AAN9SS79_PSOTE
MEEFFNHRATFRLVPSVQELAKHNLSTVPQRYIQPQHEDIVVLSDEANGSLEIPVIDLQSLLSEPFGGSEFTKLHLAYKEWLVNHGVSSYLLDKVKMEIQEFFSLPMSEKKKFWQTTQHLERYGQTFVVSEDQKLDWYDAFYMTSLPRHSRMPHLFPKLPVPLRDTLELYSQKMKNIAMIIIGHMTKALNVIGLTNHSDSVGLTILLHVNEVEGLQNQYGMWVPIKPMPNAFVVNVGDILEIITNGMYQSSEHRATVNSEKERFSFATFYSPRQDVVMGPWPSLSLNKHHHDSKESK